MGALRHIPVVGESVESIKHTKNVLIFAGGVGALAVVGTLAGMAFGITGVEATADLNKAMTSSEASLLKYDDQNQKLDIADAYFHEVFTATHAPYIVNTTPKDVIRDAEVNLKIDDVGANKFEIPLSALQWSRNAKTHKHDVVVDGTKATVLAYWPGAGPDVQYFTLNKDGKAENMEDRSGFRKSMLGIGGALLRGVNLDALPNTLDNLDAKIAHDAKLKALQTFTEACAPKLQDRNEAAINKAITNMIPTDERDKLGSITIQNLTWKTEIAPPEFAKGKTFPSNINSFEIKNFKVDRVECNVPKPEGVQ